LTTSAVVTPKKASSTESVSIRCLKGSKMKRVVAAKPKCPQGWKRA
jgi:hypothetical protein